MISFIVLDKTEHSKLKQCYSLHQRSQPNPWKYETFLDMSNEPYKIFCGVDTNDEIVGYCVGLNVIGEVTLMDIAVEPRHRHNGVGHQILESFIKYFRTKNVNMVILEVRESNENALGLYRKLNFIKIASRANYYPGIENALERENATIMTLKL